MSPSRAPAAPSPVLVPTVPELLRTGPPPRTVLRPCDVGGPVAWQVLVREGAVTVVRGDAGCAPGTRVDAALRAGLVGPEVPTGAVVTGRTAAWIHTGAGDGSGLDLTYPAGRHQPDRPAGARLWQSPLLTADVVRLAGVPVTSPERTVVELVLRDGDPVDLVAALAGAGVDLGRARLRLERRPRAQGRPRARRLLREAEDLVRARTGTGRCPGVA